MHTHVHVHGWTWRVFLWRRETDGGCLLLLSTLLLKTEALTGPGALWFGKTTWPPSSREPPVCLSRSKTSVMHDFTAPFTRTLGIWTPVLVFTVYQASYFSSSTTSSSDLSPKTRVEQLVADCKSSSHSCKASLGVTRTFSDDRLWLLSCKAKVHWKQ